MNDEFVLTRGVLGKCAAISLTREEFEQSKAAKAVVVEALAVEQRISLVFDNYIEYESMLLRGALERLVYAETSWSELTEEVYTVNRHVLNLLSATRSYLDQLRHFASSFFGRDSDECRQVTDLMSEQYDTLLGYRAMEALRNFAQHRGTAVHVLTCQFWWVDNEDDDEARRVCRTTLVPLIQPRRLREEGGFKAAVLDELEGETVDLRPLIKQYVAGISVLHGKIRELLRSRVVNADAVLVGAIDRYKRDGESTVLGLLAARCCEDGTWAEQIHIFSDIVERRQTLEVRHRIHKSLWKHFITNEPK